MCKKLICLCVVGLLCGLSGPSMAQIQVAGELLVDLRAADLPYGPVAPGTIWRNRGTLDDFAASGDPVVEDVLGRKAVTFPGASWFIGPSSVPAIEGSGDRTIEIWALNPSYSAEETMVSWSRRGGPNGSNMAFNFGNNTSYGAVAHWGGAYDRGWGAPHTPAPAVETWWYLVYTYDGTTVRVYVNGEENIAANIALNTHSGDAIRVAAQGDGAGTGTSFPFTGSIAEVRIHSSALSPEAIARNFTARVGVSSTSPSPEDQQDDVPLDVILAWEPGEFANTHDVYFGTVFADVNDADRADTRGVLVSRDQTGTTYEPGLLDLNTTYYWRIDDVNAPPDSTIFKGDVWSFTTEPYSYMVPDVNATASVEATPGSEIGKVIDRSGLSDDGGHSIQTADMWSTQGWSGDSVTLDFAFDRIYKLHEMLVWNYNHQFEQWLGWSVQDVKVEYSTDANEWVVLGDYVLPRGTGQVTLPAEPIDFGGVAAKYVRLNITSNYGGNEIGLSEVQFYYVPTFAREPRPQAGAIDVDPGVILSWRRGREAVSHEVYLGTDSNAVAAGDALVGTVDTASYDTRPLNLLLDAQYYWKVTEVNEAETPAVWEGDLWNFSTLEYFVVDDFEGYDDDDNRIYEAWVDGFGIVTNGSQVGHDARPYAERAIVRSGSQSMPFRYGQEDATSSEATLTLDAPQDWTQAGVEALVFYVRGSLGNDPVQMYVEVNGTQVYNNSVTMTAPLWQQIVVDLAPLGNAARSVTSLTIGVSGAGSGLFYVDDVRLYREAPVIPEPVDPGTANLVAFYEMENNLVDGSGNGRDGSIEDIGASFGPGPAGYGSALVLDGAGGYAELPIGSLIASLESATFGMWINWSGAGGAWQRAFDFGSGTGAYLFLAPSGGGNLRFAITAEGVGESILDASPLAPGWHHVAVAIDAETGTMAMYRNGALVASGPTETIPSELGVTTQNWIGRSQYAADAYFDGAVDDLRIYDRALSEPEIRYLVGGR